MAVDQEHRVIAIGSCKWTAGEILYSEKTKLQALAEHLAPDGPPPDLYFFARNGFDVQLQADATREARIHLITPEELVSAADTAPGVP